MNLNGDQHFPERLNAMKVFFDARRRGRGASGKISTNYDSQESTFHQNEINRPPDIVARF